MRGGGEMRREGGREGEGGVKEKVAERYRGRRERRGQR